MTKIRTVRPHPLLSLLLAMSLTACASAQRRVELKTEPEGARVATIDGNEIGTTPLTLSGQELEKVAPDNRLAVLLESPGYVPRQLLFDLHGDDSHTVSLTRLDESYFSQRLLKDFPKDANEMARTLLKIQGLIMVKSLDEAERLIGAFQNRFPSIAAAYTLLGNIELLRGNGAKARTYLLRAEALDPEDPEIKRGLGIQVKSEAPSSKTGSKKSGTKAPKGKAKK